MGGFLRGGVEVREGHENERYVVKEFNLSTYEVTRERSEEKREP